MDNNKTWKIITNKIKSQISAGLFQTFFKGSGIKSISDTEITLVTPSLFHQQNITTRFLPILEEAIEQVIGKKLTITFIVNSSRLSKKTKDESLEDLFEPEYIPQTPSINPKFTLENFVVGPTNNVAYAAAQAIVLDPGTSYNPLFLYGGTGVGKTHLMLGIGNAILKKFHQYKIIYCSSDKFMNDYVAAIQSNSMGQFRNKYRNVDILLIDDIQFFSGREGTQEEFFHTFNELQSKGSQMVFTSDRTPHEIAKLEDRLVSRFAGGLMLDIQSPDFDTRVAILQAKCQERGVALPEETINLLASTLEFNIRELEGKLIQILQIIKSKNIPPTIENISPLIGQPIKKNSTDYKQLLKVICDYFKVDFKDLTGPRRQKELILPRHIAMYLLSQDLNMTVEKIGQTLGGRDHTTVMHGRDKIKGLSTTNIEVQKILVEIKQSLSTL